MPELTREEKLKLIEKLPERLRDFLYSEDTGAVLLYFEKKYNLSGEKAGSLSKLVADIVLGITPITSLAQEINSKITSDAQAAMNLAQELNTELLAPIMAPSAQATPVPIPAPAAIPPRPVAPPATPTPATKPTDTYREPVNGAPEIIDLRKTPPSPAEAGYGRTPPEPLATERGQRPPVTREGGLPPGLPISAAPIPPSPRRSPDEGGPKPLTFTKPIERPLIEAEPHRTPTPIPTPQPSAPPIATSPRPPVASRLEPQYIIRPPGLAPTDLPHDVLDLRKDKGEF